MPVYRFFNKKNGSHFYTAVGAEKASVLSQPEQDLLARWRGVSGQHLRPREQRAALPLLQQEERQPLLHGGSPPSEIVC